MKHHILYSFFCTLVFSIVACTDDSIQNEYRAIPEGESTVNATVEFKPLTAALTGKTRSAGNAIRNIRHLCVLLYDSEEKLVQKYSLPSGQFSLQEENRPSDTEPQTPRATFKLNVPYGRYYIYAVANMGDLSAYENSIQTVEGLKNISLDWQSNKVAANDQMFGYFTLQKEIRDVIPLLTISQKNMQLHAWIRRAASKVTVAYDGSKLEEGVFIYIKSVQIKDIPRNCLLGDTNTPQEKKQLFKEGETITYAEGTSYDETWPARITKGRPYYPYDETTQKLRDNAHAETAEALFFYENMQGIGKDKRQDANGDKIPDYPGQKEEGSDGYKDNMPYGSYIEVRAYYRSINPEDLGNGNIIYRFMLGKNTTTDYNAERNHHYKLTLKFNRFANNVDWHIDYTEEIPSIQVPEPYFISYLYDHSMMLPLEINGGSYKITGLSAEIDTNAWAPYNAPNLDYYREMDPEETPGAPLNPWNGFLSLRKTSTTVITMGSDKTITDANTENKKYYEEKERGTREYNELTEGEHGSDTDGKYSVKTDPSKNKITFHLPMYTRAKQLITATGYTGNNPYVAYRRKAVVKFTATLEDQGGEQKKIEKHATIMQVRRVVNPKGIWRKYNNNTPFHVVLKHLPKESGTEFQTFTSEGAWKAYVVCGDKNFITLDGKAETQGSTGSPVDFTIGFQGSCGENESRCAIVRVEYHDYSCYHLIFVRQGQAPMALIPGGSKWHTCNMRTRTQEASCPAEEGSLFKFGNWDEPIDATNNKNDKSPWINIGPEDFKDHKDSLFLIAGTNEKKLWSAINSSDHRGSFSDPVVNGKTVSVATYKDYNDLFEHKDIEQGYGVLYGNDATETLSKIEEVYGHCYDTHGDEHSPGHGYGMRGCFVYNNSENPEYGGRNLFFPIGTSGYGHRKHSDPKGIAVLRYSAGRAAPMTENIQHRPLFYDLYLRPGAIYWLKQKVNGRQENALGWDFNYFTFDYNLISSGNIFGNKEVANTSDACFIRCVEKD